MAGLVYLDYICVIEMLDRIQQVTNQNTAVGLGFSYTSEAQSLTSAAHLQRCCERFPLADASKQYGASLKAEVW